MDVVRFDIKRYYDPWKKAQVDVIDVIINDVQLRALIGELERPFAESEGNPSLAGEYVGLEAEVEIPSPRTHFLGAKDSNLLCEPEDHTVLLKCEECGDPWCWPLMARITVLERFVIWSDFVQPHRQDTWRYDGVKFTFSRQQYDEALSALDQLRPP